MGECVRRKRWKGGEGEGMCKEEEVEWGKKEGECVRRKRLKRGE